MICNKIDKKLVLKKVNKLFTLFWVICGLTILWFFLQITTFTTFYIPSDSMAPTLIAGDQILVDKWTMGGRIFNVYDALDKKYINIYRLPSIGTVKRNDILVFNFPYPTRWDSIGFDIRTYYVKRCIALPGDTLEIRNGYYKVRGVDKILGNLAAQRRISSLYSYNMKGIVMETYPWNKTMGWTVQEFGPFSIPAKGQCVKMDAVALILYKSLIEWEQQKKSFCKDGHIYLNDSLITEYIFQENYYFMSGDNMENSRDSRYWGVLPESYIVGRVILIWKSRDKVANKIRWNRIFKKIE